MCAGCFIASASPRFRDRVLLSWAASPRGAAAIQWRMLLSIADSWERPRFPLTGRDAMAAGVPEGPEVGRVLAARGSLVAGRRLPAGRNGVAGETEKRDRDRRVSLALLDQLSLPGERSQAERRRVGASDHAALVLDGATPLGPSLLPGPSDAAWIAQFGARRLAAHLKDGDAPGDALKHALEDAARSFIGLAREPIREKWQTPCASMMMVTLGRDPPPPRAKRMEGEVVVAGPRVSEDRRRSTIEFLWFGDCAALIEQDAKVTLIGEAMEKRKAEAERARRIAREKNISAAAGINRPEIEPLLRAARNRINSGKNWLFSPDMRAASHVSRQTRSLETGSSLLIASDGFLALVTDYDAYDSAGLMMAAKSKGLAALGRELRAIEDGDAAGTRYSRFKKSDDATAILLRVG